MPLEGVFIEPSSNPVPDLSLHISPPNISSPSSLCTNKKNNNISNKADASFNLLGRQEATDHKPNTVSSMRSDSQAYIELSLAHPTTGLDEESRRSRRNLSSSRAVELPQFNPCHQQSHNHQQQQHLHHSNSTTHHLNHINHGVSLLEVSDGLRPIKGIPVYHNRSFPFTPLEQYSSRENKDPKMCFYQMPYPSSSFFSPSVNPHSSSSTSSPYSIGGGGGLNPMSMLNSSGPNQALPGPYNRLAPTTRFNGLSMDAFKSHQLHHHHHHHNQYGVGSTEGSPHGLIRSRFFPKLPTKRSMRAPRMRWTSTLHARFVHAVELLGGHESKELQNFLLLFSFFFPLFATTIICV